MIEYIHKLFMNSIITKFIIIFSVIFLTISVSIFYFLLNTTEDTLRKQISDDLTILAETQEGYLLTFMEQVKGRVADFSTDGLIRNYTEEIVSSIIPSKETINAFNAHLKNNKQSVDKTIMGILIVDNDGKVIASTNGQEIGKDEKEEFYFKEMIELNLDYGSSQVSDIFVSDHFKAETPGFFVSSPIFSVDKKTKLGYIMNQISLEEINKIMDGTKQIELGSPTGIKGRRMTQDVYLINKEGLLITPSIYKYHEGLLKQKIDSPLTRGCSEKKELTEIYNNFFGTEVLGASMCLPLHSWTLATEISTDEAFLVIKDLRKNILVSRIILLVILMILSGLFLYYLIIRNILALRRGAQIIGSGNFGYEIDIRSKDELGRLAEDFNLMAKRLKISFDGLEISSNKIKESEKKYKSMFNGAADAIIIADSEGNFLEVNEKAIRMMGYSQAELLGMNHLQIYNREDMARCLDEFKSVLAKRGCFIENVNIIKKDKSLVPADMGISVFEYGNQLRLQFLFHDISERIALEKHHKEIDHLKSQFINVVSHQLRTPLNSIRWNLEVLLAGDLGKFKTDQEKFLKTIYTSNKNIIDIISDLFLALEIEEGPITLEKEIINFEMLINDIIEGFKNELAIKRLKFNLSIHKNKKPLIVEADHEKLKQVLTRLIDNAIKYSKEESGVGINIEIAKNNAIIKIIDQGIGIPKDEQQTIFGKFFRASNAAAIHQNASGLGLFIAKKIIEAHKGDIWFDSTEGKGTTFYISLPMSG